MDLGSIISHTTTDNGITCVSTYRRLVFAHNDTDLYTLELKGHFSSLGTQGSHVYALNYIEKEVIRFECKNPQEVS